MTTVQDHYAKHLGPIYLWMAGGAEAALQAGDAEIEALKLPIGDGDLVLDLGAGFGMHSIPVARRGARVTAIDTSDELLRSLVDLAGKSSIATVNDDLLAFPSHITAAPKVILCMGDTITHLPTQDAVDRLIEKASLALMPGAVFVISFRDYSVPLAGDQRFIPVRGDDSRILVCFLEYTPDTVVVHDILHQRNDEGWLTRVSHCQKLRLAPEQLAEKLEANGFNVRREPGVRGMVRIVATRV